MTRPRPFVAQRWHGRGRGGGRWLAGRAFQGGTKARRAGEWCPRRMDALGGRRLATKAPTMMSIVTDEQSRDISPSWYLARAGSPSPEGSLEIAAMKPAAVIPESQMMPKNDLELIRAQLQAQTKAFQALSHSITLLEQESRQQQERIKKLEEEVQFAVCSPCGEAFDGLLKRRIQEVWKAVAKEVEGLHGSMIQKENSVQSLSQEVLESKKFLWEELEAVQGELRCIHQKLKDQEVGITRNLVSIKKMQENQMKCTRLLTQLRGKIPEDTPETVNNKPVSEELNDIWSAINTLRNSITSWRDKRGSSRMKGQTSRQQRRSAVQDSSLSDSALHQRHRTSETSS
nr:coiled-coil domain-containing protein 159 isoform X2 [Pogona vitticeps]